MLSLTALNMVKLICVQRAPAVLMFFFFFQAEDGIRDYKVTGVQTCALPIYADPNPRSRRQLPGGSTVRWRLRGVAGDVQRPNEARDLGPARQLAGDPGNPRDRKSVV